MISLVNIKWIGDASSGYLRLLDQTRLPLEEIYLECRTVEGVWDAIKRLSVRGAPAIGIAAAYATVIGARLGRFDQSVEYLSSSRPTAVNLFWALERMKRVDSSCPELLLKEASRIHEEDSQMCRQIGSHGFELMQSVFVNVSGRQPALLTHCNAGSLATGGIGTATAPMYIARERNLPLTVYVDETRPLLQGARLTAFELQAAGIDIVLISDNMAAQVMREKRVDAIVTGADRIAANGDTSNKIGTYSLAVLAAHHGIPMYIAAPSSTFDLSIPNGCDIPIEQRGAEEITAFFGCRTAPENVRTYCPAFDVTPAELITAMITERGVIQPVSKENVKLVIGGFQKNG